VTFIEKMVFKRERCNLTEFDFRCRNMFVECFVFASKETNYFYASFLALKFRLNYLNSKFSRKFIVSPRVSPIVQKGLSRNRRVSLNFMRNSIDNR